MERVEIGICDKMMDFIKEKIFFCCSFKLKRFHLSGNKKVCLKVQKAAEPDEIIWENLGYSSNYRFWAQCKTNILTMILLLFCFGLIFGISYIQVKKKINSY